MQKKETGWKNAACFIDFKCSCCAHPPGPVCPCRIISAHPADTHSATARDKVQALGADSTLLTAGQQRLKLEDTGQLAM